MGSCLSGDATAGAFSGVQQQELLLKFADLRTSMHLNETEFIRMYKYFAEANLNDDGCIQLDEFLVFFGQSKSRFTVRVYDMFRDDNEEGITFKQWVFALWNFCTTDSDALILFGFQLYDKGGKGLLDLKDIEHMMVELFGNDYEANGLAKDLLKSLLDTDYKGNPTTSGVTAARFAKVCARAKNILYPAFKLQHQIQSRIFSERFWHDKTEQRLKMQREGQLDIREVLTVLNAGRRRAEAHVVRGGIIMPYVSARGASESQAEKAERERMERLTDIVGGEEMSTMLQKNGRARVSIAPGPPEAIAIAAGALESGAESQAKVRASPVNPPSAARGTSAPPIASPLSGAVAGIALGRKGRNRVSPTPPELQNAEARGRDGAGRLATARSPAVMRSRTVEVSASPTRFDKGMQLKRVNSVQNSRAKRLTAATRRKGF